MKSLIIVPAFNEEQNLPGVVKDLRKNCPESDILAVNDCSTDDTLQVLEEQNILFLNLPVNLGIGGAVQSGYKYAVENGYDIAVQFDGDGQHDAKYVKALMEPIETGTADLVIGSRFIEKQGFQSSGMRRFGINFLSGLIFFLAGVRVKDVTSGMRATNRKLFSYFAEHYAQDYPEPEAVMCAGLTGARITEIPVKMKERAHGKSSIKSFGSVYYMLKVTLALLFDRSRGRKSFQ